MADMSLRQSAVVLPLAVLLLPMEQGTVDGGGVREEPLFCLPLLPLLPLFCVYAYYAFYCLTLLHIVLFSLFFTVSLSLLCRCNSLPLSRLDHSESLQPLFLLTTTTLLFDTPG